MWPADSKVLHSKVTKAFHPNLSMSVLCAMYQLRVYPLATLATLFVSSIPRFSNRWATPKAHSWKSLYINTSKFLLTFPVLYKRETSWVLFSLRIVVSCTLFYMYRLVRIAYSWPEVILKDVLWVLGLWDIFSSSKLVEDKDSLLKPAGLNQVIFVY